MHAELVQHLIYYLDIFTYKKNNSILKNQYRIKLNIDLFLYIVTKYNLNDSFFYKFMHSIEAQLIPRL